MFKPKKCIHQIHIHQIHICNHQIHICFWETLGWPSPTNFWGTWATFEEWSYFHIFSYGHIFGLAIYKIRCLCMLQPWFSDWLLKIFKSLYFQVLRNYVHWLSTVILYIFFFPFCFSFCLDFLSLRAWIFLFCAFLWNCFFVSDFSLDKIKQNLKLTCSEWSYEKPRGKETLMCNEIIIYFEGCLSVFDNSLLSAVLGWCWGKTEYLMG